ncbi:cytochrome c-type biogenesis protein CcmH [Nicoletella semolina]|uniref:Cytochrome c-type biogenesis protein n=1 Tax=Nicoletella semolina TaxID=271160 RepID=A0A4R2N5B9_9PAST|nr:cytochrome c-type biogenesis protein [Nicoletella semolina]MDH2924774.1 cystathionine gamma-synthase [Nicoletella semolina]TCP15991.1 cytochrome c-type biogenesis protein CcmH [Nicoletella semolina]
MKKIILICLYLLPSLAIASLDIEQFDSPKQEADYRTLIQELRCPQCQNNNIADSNATIATDMRNKTLELLKQGKSKDEIVEYMIERYGHFVTYDPPITPATILLWVIPLLLVLFGLFFLAQRKKTAKQAVNSDLNSEKMLDQARLNAILNKREK